MNIVKNILEKPLRTIAENAGKVSNEVLQKVSALQTGWGFDANTGEYVDMIKSGIIDPVKVTRSGVENAASAAAVLLTTEAAVADADCTGVG